MRPANSCFILQRGKPYIFERWYFFHSPLASVLQEFLESRLCLPSLLSLAPRIDCSCQSRMVPWKQRLPQACLICSILCSELTYATPHISKVFFFIHTTHLSCSKSQKLCSNDSLRLSCPSFFRVGLTGAYLLVDSVRFSVGCV